MVPNGLDAWDGQNPQRNLGRAAGVDPIATTTRREIRADLHVGRDRRWCRPDDVSLVSRRQCDSKRSERVSPRLAAGVGEEAGCIAILVRGTRRFASV